jgi:hypothetical protein
VLEGAFEGVRCTGVPCGVIHVRVHSELCSVGSPRGSLVRNFLYGF